MAVQVTWQNKFFHINFSGVVSSEELEKVHSIWSSDPRSDSTKCAICNFLNADLKSISIRNIIECSARDKGASMTISNINIAFIARDEDVIQLCKEYIAMSVKLASTWNFSIFDNVDDAYEWSIIEA